MKSGHGVLGAALMSALLAASLLTSGCGVVARAVPEAGATKNMPSRVEPIDGSELSRVILTDEAAERLDIQMDQARSAEYEGAPRTVVPYAAVLYDVNGDTWVYTNPEPGTFVRYSIDVDSIDGNLAVLSQGPPVGTAVVIVGAAELFGAEFEFHEQ